MSGRRPSNPELLVAELNHNVSSVDPSKWHTRKASVDEVIAVVRRGVESGTIKGWVVAWCERHQATGASDSEGYGVCWFIMFVELMPKAYPDWSEHANHLPCKMTEPYGALLIPVSDGGSET